MAAEVKKSTIALSLPSELCHSSKPNDGPAGEHEHLSQVLHENQPTIEQLEREQQRLIEQIKEKLKQIPSEQELRQSKDPKAKKLLQLRKQLQQNFDTIVERQHNLPKKLYLSVNTADPIFVPYIKAVREKIEQRAHARLKQMQGHDKTSHLIVSIDIQSSGTLVSTAIIRSSGNPHIDGLILEIISSASPLGEFSAAMKQQCNEIVLISPMELVSDKTLQ